MTTGTKSDMSDETKQIVLKYSKLARLCHKNLSEHEISEHLSFFREKDFRDVIKMIKSLETIDTTSIPEHFMFFDFETHRNLNDDIASDTNNHDTIMANAKSKYGYFIVPQVIEDSE